MNYTIFKFFSSLKFFSIIIFVVEKCKLLNLIFLEYHHYIRSISKIKVLIVTPHCAYR